MSDGNKLLSFDKSNPVYKLSAAGILLTATVCAVLVHMHLAGWAIGMAAGSAISLFSLLSVGILIPIVMMPNAPGASQFLLGLVLFLKLPIYAILLWAVSLIPGVDMRSTVPGVILAPTLVGAHAVLQVLWEPIRESAHRRRVKRGGRVNAAPSAVRNAPRYGSVRSSVREQG